MDSDGALPESVSVSALDAPSPDAAGLFAATVTGLPADLWGMGLESEIIGKIAEGGSEPLPALQGVLMMLLLAEASPPSDSSRSGKLLMARADKLLDIGALDQAEALINASGIMNAELFRRAFDIALLTGHEDQGCEKMQAVPNLAPTFQARIFCLARSGDWNAAALTLRTAQALGQITEEEDRLLSRFLDPDLFEGEADLPVPSRITPLNWRLFEAIGEPFPTHSLPVAFSHAELMETAGWKSQIEAAERLARVGAIPPNRLLGLYSERSPAASGGVWDRVDAIQQLEAALASGKSEDISRHLKSAWEAMSDAELEVPFALLFSDSLAKVVLTGEADRIAFEIGLLSGKYESVAKGRNAAEPQEKFLIAIATGNLIDAVPQDSLQRAIAPAFLSESLGPEYQELLDQRRLGEGILLAIQQIAKGLQGQLELVTSGLTFLRHVGMEDAARRTALQLVLLERRG
ncbi:hypothetical protein ACSBLW_03660 [Thioclava sp. FR2]|uniref:hypothetical protein n=1 Tax=Thioclava sp. FR2 TaxID=3445780 RepID=UPI003EBE9556